MKRLFISLQKVVNRILISIIVLLSYSSVTFAQNDAIIYLDSTAQIIRGFGAANILPWRPDMTASEITKAFGTGEGELGFSILRLRIPHVENEFNMNVRTAKAAYEMGVTIIASPWTPPAWMKTNNNIIGGELRENNYSDYADHLNSFIDFMNDNGIPLYAVSVQNEPDIQVNYESCDWTPEQLVKFMKENASSIKTKVFAPESFQFRRPISDAILNDSLACANLDFIGGHIYGGGLSPYPLAEEKGKEIWMTEHLDTDVSWSNVLATGKEINDCMNAGMSAYIWWYIIRFYGPILEDGNVSKRGYIMSHYSRFIRPRYYRVHATSVAQRNVYLSSYINDTRLVIVVVNTGSSPVDQTFVLNGGNAQKFIPYVTSQTKNVEQENEIVVSGNTFSTTIEGQSVITFVSDDLTNVKETNSIPQAFRLSQNYPNPFNPTTQIQYSVPTNSFISLKVFTLLGEEVKTLVQGQKQPGTYEVTFNGEGLSNGIYMYQLRANDFVETKKLMLLK